jgi:tRNA nucleotidyltransferase (CCA-adding enzyme)
VDFFNGIEDLKNGIIRVLHDKSFIDDPTRIFRAVRFEQRYNFEIDAHTRHLIDDAVKAGMLDKLKKQRKDKEITLISKEKNAGKMLQRLKAIAGI